MVKMEFSEDFAEVQGILNQAYKSIGNFTNIRHVGGNEEKITKVVEGLQQFIIRKKYIKDGKVNQKHEIQIRKLILFLILNTELLNKSPMTNNKLAHLIDIIPQFSKCLLTNVIFKLGLCQYYGEAISSCPIQISLELLENCSKCIKKSDPYEIIEQTSTIASSIYFKVYHMRYETNTKLDAYIAKLLEKFSDILKNYITPVTDQILTWQTDKMYQYMGQTILEILNLLKNCLNVYNMKEYVASYYQFYQISQETQHSLIDSPNTLNKSNELLKEFNKQLTSVCEGNVIAVTIDVFCSWAECTVNDVNLQEAVAYLAYEVLELIQKIEDIGVLPKMLSAISRKPQTIEDKINSADKSTILKNVIIKSQDQTIWYKAFLRSGIFEAKETYDTFKSLINLSDSEDYIFLLSLNTENEFYFKEYLIQNILEIPPEDSMKIISEYFIKTGINNLYELEDFDIKVRELFNKLKCDTQIPFKEISILVLQNPIKFVNNLLEESDKNSEHLINILQILKYISPICNLKCNDKEHTVLHEMVLNKLKHSNFESDAENCIIQLINELIKCRLLSNIIFDQLQDIIEESIGASHFNKADFVCRLYKTLPMCFIPSDNYTPFILKLGYLMKQLRWTFFSYSEEKVSVTSEIISLIYHYKSNQQEEIICENIKRGQDLDKINAFHIFQLDSNNFLNYVNEGYDVNSNHHEQVTRLINLLPRCVPLEWDFVAKYLIKHKNPVAVLQLFIDVMLILSEMSKKSNSSQDSLSYCFQQFCIIVKDITFLAEDPNLDKALIKNICRLIKHLPDSLHNTIEISLVSLFNFDVLKSLKDDEDFVYSLVSISHLNICKIICSKMT